MNLLSSSEILLYQCNNKNCKIAYSKAIKYSKTLIALHNLVTV